VSGVYRGRPGGEESSPGIPSTNLSQDVRNTILSDPDTGKKTIDQDLVSYYLDCIAQVETPEAKSYLPFPSKKCGQWCAVGECENGHRFAFLLNCRHPYCSICGVIEHQRKIAAFLPRVQQLLPAALLTIRPPNDCQVFERNRYARRRFIKAVIHALKSLGYRRGIIFIHLFGDDKTKYAFHLHVLVDGDWLEPEELDDLCRKLRRMIYPRWVVRKWGDSLIVNYHYKQTQGEIYHSLFYCSRPTFTHFEGNEWLADSIRGEKLVRTWGRWHEAPKWHLDDSGKKVQALVSLEKGKCPICGEPLVWFRKPTYKALVEPQIEEDLGGGYYRLRTIRAPPGRPLTPQLKAS
jgi:endogenous inhibitor of DNA gyrase (YacG/DUF329 family)